MSRGHLLTTTTANVAGAPVDNNNEGCKSAKCCGSPVNNWIRANVAGSPVDNKNNCINAKCFGFTCQHQQQLAPQVAISAVVYYKDLPVPFPDKSSR